MNDLETLLRRTRPLREAARNELVNPSRDLRHAMRAYVRGYAHLFNRTAGEQVAVFIADRDAIFGDLAILAWGIDLCA